MINLFRIAVVGLAALGVANPGPIDIPIQDGSNWTVVDAAPSGPAFVNIGGRRAIHLRRGAAVFSGVSMRDGVLEADLRPTEANKGFLGLGFRTNGADHFELVYVRFGHSGQPDALQYDPYLNGSITWQLHPEAQAAAVLPADQWTHLRIVYAGRRAEVFVGDDPRPALIVPNLSEAPSAGGVGVFSLADGGYVSNLRVTPLQDVPLTSPGVVAAAGTIADWRVSPSLDVRKVDPAHYPATAGWSWRRLRTDPSGILVVNRLYRTYTDLPPSRADIEGRRAPGRLVFVRTMIRSNRERQRMLRLGFSDNATVFLNRRLIYQGNNALGFREPSHLGRISLSDEVALRLRRGTNELIIGLSDYGGGWGLMASLRP